MDNNYSPLLVFADSVKNPIKGAIGATEYYKANIRETLVLEVSGASSCKIFVEGCLTTTDENGKPLKGSQLTWKPLATINARTFEINDEIEESGVYYIALTGLKLFRLNIQGVNAAAGMTLIGREAF